MKQAILIFCAILGVLYMVTKPKGGGEASSASESKHVATGSFEAAVQNNEVVLVDFWAPWCGPCREMTPVVNSVADNYQGKVSVFKVNVDDQPGLAQKYNVRGIPTFLIFKNGKLVAREMGVIPEAQLTKYF
ncbi:thioredoxin [Cerasicoccus frondis]|uniref:thioredoxin n=1 Tax=Cerasicoccus frondis TaxID=490090 RepID=UPI0028527F10|nr:thioredoxin [Cerasicoccus frondis]